MYAQAKRNILRSLGLPLTAALASCQKAPPSPAPPAESAAASLVAPASASSEGGGPILPRIPRPPFHCPSGSFCTAPSAGGDAGQAAAPYASCALVPPAPADEDASVPFPMRQRRVTFSPELTSQARDGGANQCCYTWTVPCPGGRPLRVRGRAVVARARVLSSGKPTARRSPSLARYWTREAELEHASISAFLRLARELDALGAPRALVLATKAAARDERRHARVTFRLASSYGTTRAPGSLPSAARSIPERSLTDLAVETFVDGCAGEAAASLALLRASRRAANPRLAKTLRTMARDEQRHAILGWRILAFTLARGGDDVRRAVDTAARNLVHAASHTPDVPEVTLPAGHGALSLSDKKAIHSETVRRVVLPCLDALFTSGAGSAAA